MMKQKHLELILQQVPEPEDPNPALEQYTTPADIAADCLYTMLGCGDITGREVIDLGCGTGRLSIGAALLGAGKVTGIDADSRMIDLAKQKTEELGLDIEYTAMDIGKAAGRYDVAVMNPPFGSQNKHADRPFIEKATAIAQVVYSFHLTRTRDFIAQLSSSLNFGINLEKNYKFGIRHMFDFHGREKAEFDVTLFRLISEG